MNWKGHVFVGMVFGTVAAYVLGLGFFDFLLLIPAVIFSSLLPDADHKMSKGRAFLDYLVLLMAITPYVKDVGAFLSGGYVRVLAVYGAYSLFMLIFKPRHRGITHTLLACFVYGILVYMSMGFVASVVASSAYFSHLVADRHIRIF